MSTKRMPVVFAGHGSPMMALEDTDTTRALRRVGEQIVDEFGTPKAVLAISAHWYTKGTFVQSAPQPKQIYDMYGFPDELYQVKYPVQGDAVLTEAVRDLLGEDVRINDEWGIDHGAWTVLVHMFPDGNIPVVQLSVNAELSAEASYSIGQRLADLRDKGYLIVGSGNIVHNLGRLEWNNPGGSEAALRFDTYIADGVVAGDTDRVVQYLKHGDAAYAVPTPEHYLPLVYCLGAADGDTPSVFNQSYNTGALSMTSFIFSK